MSVLRASNPRRVIVFGASGTIGSAAVSALVARGHEVVCFVRDRAGVGGRCTARQSEARLAGAELRFGDVTNPVSLAEQGFRGEGFDAVLSCLASRTGAPDDAWAIDHRAQMNILAEASRTGAAQMVLLSAICVQKPRLAFQHAKLAFENALMQADLTWSIVRPTAYFKSLAGQLERLRRGRPFLVFGDGELTACKPISDADLAAYLADCIEDAAMQNRILPIGGPGPALTPRQQGLQLFEALGIEPRFRRVPAALLGGVAAALGACGKVLPPLAGKAELARIGHYYATESMLLLDPDSGRYDADATPETGSDRLADFYRRLADGRETLERGDHAVF